MHHAFSYAAYTLHDRAGTLASLLYKAEMTSVCLAAVTSVTRSSVHGSTWDFAYVELRSLARECMFKQVSKSLLLGQVEF